MQRAYDTLRDPQKRQVRGARYGGKRTAQPAASADITQMNIVRMQLGWIEIYAAERGENLAANAFAIVYFCNRLSSLADVRQDGPCSI